MGEWRFLLTTDTVGITERAAMKHIKLYVSSEEGKRGHGSMTSEQFCGVGPGIPSRMAYR